MPIIRVMDQGDDSSEDDPWSDHGDYVSKEETWYEEEEGSCNGDPEEQCPEPNSPDVTWYPNSQILHQNQAWMTVVEDSDSDGANPRHEYSRRQAPTKLVSTSATPSVRDSVEGTLASLRQSVRQLQRLYRAQPDMFRDTTPGASCSDNPDSCAISSTPLSPRASSLPLKNHSVTRYFEDFGRRESGSNRAFVEDGRGSQHGTEPQGVMVIFGRSTRVVDKSFDNHSEIMHLDSFGRAKTGSERDKSKVVPKEPTALGKQQEVCPSLWNTQSSCPGINFHRQSAYKNSFDRGKTDDDRADLGAGTQLQHSAVLDRYSLGRPPDHSDVNSFEPSLCLGVTMKSTYRLDTPKTTLLATTLARTKEDPPVVSKPFALHVYSFDEILQSIAVESIGLYAGTKGAYKELRMARSSSGLMGALKLTTNGARCWESSRSFNGFPFKPGNSTHQPKPSREHTRPLSTTGSEHRAIPEDSRDMPHGHGRRGKVLPRSSFARSINAPFHIHSVMGYFEQLDQGRTDDERVSHGADREGPSGDDRQAFNLPISSSARSNNVPLEIHSEKGYWKDMGRSRTRAYHDLHGDHREEPQGHRTREEKLTIRRSTGAFGSCFIFHSESDYKGVFDRGKIAAGQDYSVGARRRPSEDMQHEEKPARLGFARWVVTNSWICQQIPYRKVFDRGRMCPERALPRVGTRGPIFSTTGRSTLRLSHDPRRRDSSLWSLDKMEARSPPRASAMDLISPIHPRPKMGTFGLTGEVPAFSLKALLFPFDPGKLNSYCTLDAADLLPFVLGTKRVLRSKPSRPGGNDTRMATEDLPDVAGHKDNPPKVAIMPDQPPSLHMKWREPGSKEMYRTHLNTYMEHALENSPTVQGKPVTTSFVPGNDKDSFLSDLTITG